MIEAIQLDCSQPIGDYAGYSGSPIERSEPPDRRMLLGILLEQYPEQQLGNYCRSPPGFYCAIRCYYERGIPSL